MSFKKIPRRSSMTSTLKECLQPSRVKREYVGLQNMISLFYFFKVFSALLDSELGLADQNQCESRSGLTTPIICIIQSAVYTVPGIVSNVWWKERKNSFQQLMCMRSTYWSWVIRRLTFNFQCKCFNWVQSQRHPWIRHSRIWGVADETVLN